MRSGLLWSAAHQPVCREPERYRVTVLGGVTIGDGCIVGENVGFTNAGDASFNNYSCGGCSSASSCGS